MKNIFKLFCILSVLALSSCNDLFVTNPDNIINSDQYIATNDEAYRGFMGILTKMQDAGDQAIFLTDTRCNYLEVTPNAPIALQDIYNYDNTDGNKYADPTCYYAVINACNDFIAKVGDYETKSGAGLDDKVKADYNALVSSALRIKVWAYYTLGRIYGKAVWFDAPLNDLTNLNDSDVFTHLNDMPSIVNKCLNLLDNGIQQNGVTIPANLIMNWAAYLDPETQNATQYAKWQYLVPNYLLLRCQIMSWRGTHADWVAIRDNILQYLYDQAISVSIQQYNLNVPLTDNYYKIFYSEDVGSTTQNISSIIYDYANHQTNRLVKYFCPDYPGGGYYLRPSEYAIDSMYSETDIRSMTQRQMMTTIDGKPCFSKYFYWRTSGFLRTKIFEIEPSIILQRGHDFHFLLAEAENNLGDWRQAYDILNIGVINDFARPSLIPKDWNPNYALLDSLGGGGDGGVGIVGCVRGAVHQLPKPTDPNYNLTEQQRQKIYDLAIADEYTREYTGEGKSYSYLIKLALQYNDPDIIADRVCPKYPADKRAAIRADIESGGYWVNWDLNGDNK